MKNLVIVFLALSFGLLSACSTVSGESQKTNSSAKVVTDLNGLTKAYFASGCFWCVEAIFESVEGVSEAVSGYAGGKAGTANYSAVSSGKTEHAEAVEVYYNPKIVSYETLLVVFFDSHNPSTLNRQGNDVGPQYRSAIFYQNDEEKQAAEAKIKKLSKQGIKITTELAPLEKFYTAEDYHQDYERLNPNNGYVKAVSIPRLNRFKKKHPELLKKDGH